MDKSERLLLSVWLIVSSIAIWILLFDWDRNKDIIETITAKEENLFYYDNMVDLKLNAIYDYISWQNTSKQLNSISNKQNSINNRLDIIERVLSDISYQIQTECNK